MNDNRRIIEVGFPVEAVSKEGIHDKYKSQIAGLHIYWASRPLGPSRATAYAALVGGDSPLRPPPHSTDDKHNASTHTSLLSPKHNFIAELAKWENALNPLWIQQAREDILRSHNGKPPKILDPFGGRGAIPLEAQRLGCETHAADLNPVSVLIQKCTLEYPQRYGQRLYDDVKRWGEHILAEITAELAAFYPKEPDGSEVYAYIWARTLPCQNLHCNAVIPLMRQFWLAQKKNKKKKDKEKKIALFPCDAEGQIGFRIVGTGHATMPEGFEPAKGTISRAIVTCPLCQNTIAAEQTRRLFQEGLSGERMLAVVTQHPKRTGRAYRLATAEDIAIFKRAEERLAENRERLRAAWGIDPVPDEPTPNLKGSGAERGISIHNYNLKTYGDLFNARQQLTLVTLTEKIRGAAAEMQAQENYAPEYAKAVCTYLALWLDRIADIGSNLCLWNNTGESVVKLFGMATLPISWDYREANPFRIAENRLATVLKPMEHLCQMDREPVATVRQASAQNLPYPDNTFDAVLTDPPYYDNAAYAYLSDIFYVWLKRSIGAYYPELFKTRLTPKEGEIVAYGHRPGGLEAGKQAFETGLAQAFREMHRVLKADGIAVVVYGHKSTAGWEALINALLDSGLVVTAAWPIDTERKVRWRSYNSAALSSSIYMVARKRDRKPLGLYREVKTEMESYLQERLFQLWEWGFSGVGLFIAAIGIGIEVFGAYQQVLDKDDNVVRADKMIADIRDILLRFEDDQSGAAGTDLTRFYLRWRRQHGAEAAPFNDARELALSLGIELTEAWGAGSFIQQEKTNVRVLGPQDRKDTDLSGSEELIDILHRALLLWSSSKRSEMIQWLSKGNVGLNELIWNVAEQIRDALLIWNITEQTSGALPSKNKELPWLDGWLADKVAIQREVAKASENTQQEILS